MLVLHRPDELHLIADEPLRRFVAERFEQLGASGDGQDVCAVVAEPGDTAEQLEDAVGFPVVRDTFGEHRFGDPDFAPSAEAIEDRGAFYELTYVLSDEGSGALLFVAKADGVDAELLAMCAAHAVVPAEVRR